MSEPSEFVANNQRVRKVTGVELNQTNSELEVILKTAAGRERLVPLILPEGNNLVDELLKKSCLVAVVRVRDNFFNSGFCNLPESMGRT